MKKYVQIYNDIICIDNILHVNYKPCFQEQYDNRILTIEYNNGKIIEFNTDKYTNNLNGINDSIDKAYKEINELLINENKGE